MSERRQNMWLAAAVTIVIAVVIGQGVRGDLTRLDGTYVTNACEARNE